MFSVNTYIKYQIAIKKYNLRNYITILKKNDRLVMKRKEQDSE